MKNFFSAAVALTVLGIVCLPAHATTYNITEGVGSDFFYSAASGFTPDPLVYTGTVGGLPYYSNGSAYPGTAYVVQNFTNSTVTSSTLEIQAHSLSLDPQNVAYVAVNFIAPANGVYNIIGSFRGDDTGQHTHSAEVLSDGNLLFTTTISSYNQNVGFILSSGFLSTGELITFEVLTGPDLYNLSTGLTASISAVPEPTTWAMMFLGFCGLGLMSYRERLGSSSSLNYD